MHIIDGKYKSIKIVKKPEKKLSFAFYLLKGSLLIAFGMIFAWLLFSF